MTTRGCGGSEIKPIKRQPFIVLIEHDPWLPVLESDSPTFALYDDGLVIFRRHGKKGGNDYGSILLDRKQRDRLLSSLPLGKDFQALSDDEVSDCTDQPTNVLWVWLAHQVKRVSVYGDLRNDGEARSKTPRTFLRLFDELIGYDNEAAIPWVPEKVEVLIWPYGYSPAEPLLWPTGWPDTVHPETKKRGDGFSLFLGASYLQDLKGLLRQLGQNQAVLINGKKWAISYRFPFPNEPLWMEPSVPETEGE